MKLTDRQISLREGFKNHGEPHIWFERGYWRCCPFQKPYSEHRRWAFDQAHMFINALNAKLNKR